MDKTYTVINDFNIFIDNDNFSLDYNNMNNKLFCTFSSKSDLEATLVNIQSKYKILFNKIFVLYVESTEEYVCTYNIDHNNMSGGLLENTILEKYNFQYDNPIHRGILMTLISNNTNIECDLYTILEKTKRYIHNFYNK